MASKPVPIPDESIDTDAVRTRLLQIKEDRGLSWSRLALLTGVKQGSLTNFAGGTYNASDAAKAEVAARIARWFVSDAEQAKLAVEVDFEEPAFQPTQASREIMAVLQWAQRGKMCPVVAAPGFGKTSAIRQYQAERANVWIATISPSNSSVPNMLVSILAAMGEADARGTPQQLTKRISDRVAMSRGLIVIDEAQHLSEQSLEELRALYDATGIGIALVGNELLQARIEGGGQRKATPQLSSRMSMPLIRKLPYADDGEILARACGADDLAIVGFCRDLARQPGGLRFVVRTFELAHIFAAGDGKPLALNHMRDAWSKLSNRVLA